MDDSLSLKAREGGPVTSLRALAVCFALAAISSSVAFSAATWRDKVAPAVLRWIDSGSQEERELIVRVGTGSGSAEALSSYAATSHLAWLSEERAATAGIGIWAEFERTFAVQRAGSAVWEMVLPYVHELRSVLARASADDARQVAQLSTVVAILDGAAAVPGLGPFTGARVSPAAAAPPAPSGLLALTSVSGEELEAWMSTLGWCYLTRQDIAISEGLETPIGLSSSALALGDSAHDLVGLAVSDEARLQLDANGATLSSAFVSASWAAPSSYAPTVADLSRLLEAMEQMGADEVGIASITLRGDIAQLYILLRSAEGAGWASLAAPGPGTSTTQDALPRAEAPTEVFATLGSYADRVVVQWRPVLGASTYEILRAATNSGAYEPIGIAEETTFQDTGVETCVQYSYVARSISHGGVGWESSRAVGFVGRVPMPPTRIWTDGGAVAGAIRVEWTPSDEATRYQVMRTQYMTGSTMVAAKQYTLAFTSDPSLLDTDVIVGQTYLYRVFACNGCGQSELSPQAKGVALYSLPPPAGELMPPSWFETTRGDPRYEIIVSWTAAQGADSYIVLRSLSYGGEYVEVARVTGTAWHDDDVELCGDYWYRIQSVSGSAVSTPSPILYGICGYRPVAPERVRASHGTYSQSIRVDWAAVDDASSYLVSRAPSKDGPFAVIATGLVELYYVDEGLSPGQAFWYKVRAVNPCGCSGDLGAASGSTSSRN